MALQRCQRHESWKSLKPAMKKAAFILTMQLVLSAVEAQPVITQQPTNQIIAVGGTAIFTVSVSGTVPFTYQWEFNSTNLQASTIITTVAGNGTASYSGDGGIATSASLYWPSAVAKDAAGNLFIADYYNYRIRKVATNGIITTVAGNGTASFFGDGGPATNASLNRVWGILLDAVGNLFIADQQNNCIRK